MKKYPEIFTPKQIEYPMKLCEHNDRHPNYVLNEFE